ncbi:OLC1v1019896C1 [Oldenlandia corymbosa var. corymbosa]|uniref:OLC1v1019896C1 n=1 Tax=Oldenlandia corymbosa var. corymbosa TaxID=529605 RepID=A0AAV1EFJ7_OLDCO|nr:OLC1v1019896C1 [Oldenlandia corymbosa var. corymbosa]
MPFPMRIQPIGSEQEYREASKPPPVLKSRLKRLFDRPFNSVLKISSADKPPAVSGEVKGAAVVPEFEPSSVCLDKMVQNFMEESPFEKPQTTQKCGRNRCNCFNGNSNDSSDDEFDFGFGDSVSNTNSSFGDSIDSLKSLIPCSTTVERNLLADTSKIVEKNKTCKRKDDLRKIVTDGLIALGFNASICKSKWDKTSSIPAGEYEYIDVIVEGERVLIDIDFRSEFEIARSTGNYKAILQSLPFIFVGGIDRLQQIIAIVSEAARLSLKKKGMHIAPWRKAEYMKAKWISPSVRTTVPPPQPKPIQTDEIKIDEAAAEEVVEAEAEAAEEAVVKATEESEECGELELIFGEESETSDEPPKSSPPVMIPGEEAKGKTPVIVTWQPPVIKPLSCERSNRVMVTGLASLLKEKP